MGIHGNGWDDPRETVKGRQTIHTNDPLVNLQVLYNVFNFFPWRMLFIIEIVNKWLKQIRLTCSLSHDHGEGSRGSYFYH